MTRSIPLLLAALLTASCGWTSSDRDAAPLQVPSTPSPTTTPSASPEGSYAFAVLGDFGSGLEGQTEVAERMCRYRESNPFEIVLTTGDNVYPDGDPAAFDEVLAPYRCLFDAGVRFHASLGNHDVKTGDGRPLLQDPRFGMEGRNYIVRTGGVRFVVADSNALDRGWLRSALRATEGDRWTVVVFHHPVFSSGSEHGSTPGFRPGLPRLFARRGVDLVLNGHDHNYEATEPVRGVRYVVTGGGGADARACGPSGDLSELCVGRLHFVYVKVLPERLLVRAVPPEGAPFHSFSIR